MAAAACVAGLPVAAWAIADSGSPESEIAAVPPSSSVISETAPSTSTTLAPVGRWALLEGADLGFAPGTQITGLVRFDRDLIAVGRNLAQGVPMPMVVWRSADGRAWREVESAANLVPEARHTSWAQVTDDGLEIFVPVADGWRKLTTTDLESWSNESIPTFPDLSRWEPPEFEGGEPYPGGWRGPFEVGDELWATVNVMPSLDGAGDETVWLARSGDGENWTLDSEPMLVGASVQFLSEVPHGVVAVGAGPGPIEGAPTIFAGSPALWLSTDGGESWQERPSPTPAALQFSLIGAVDESLLAWSRHGENLDRGEIKFWSSIDGLNWIEAPVGLASADPVHLIPREALLIEEDDAWFVVRDGVERTVIIHWSAGLATQPAD